VAAFSFAVVLTIAPSRAEAVLYDFSFTGTIWDVNGLPGGIWQHVDVGSIATITYRMDSEEEDIVPGDSSAIYYYDSISFDIDGTSMVIEPLGIHDYVYVTTDSSFGGSADEYSVGFGGLELGVGGGVTLVGWDDTFSSDELPLSLDLDQFFFQQLYIGFDLFQFTATVDSFTATPVPEPMGAAVFLFLVPKRRRRR